MSLQSTDRKSCLNGKMLVYDNDNIGYSPEFLKGFSGCCTKQLTEQIFWQNPFTFNINIRGPMKESNKSLTFGLWPGWVKIFNTLLQRVLFSDCEWVPPRAFLSVPIGTAQCAVNHSLDFHGMVDQAFSEEKYYCVLSSREGLEKSVPHFFPWAVECS